MSRFAGIMPPLVTPLDASGRLDEAGLRRFVEHVLQGGVHGVVVLGSSGEAALLPPEVKRRVVGVTLEAVNGRVPVIVGTGEAGTTLTGETTRLARQAGATAAIVVPPYYYHIDQEAVQRHYRTVREVGGLPVLAYHIPGLTKVPVLSETLLLLAEEGTLSGVKDSAGDFGYYQRVVDGTRALTHFAALQGSDQFLFAGMAYGGDGAISVMSQVAPAVMVGLYDAARAGDWTRAKSLHRRYQQIAAAIGPGWIPAVKGALSALGICGPYVSTPNVPLPEERLATQRQRIEVAQADGLFAP
ncbi:MAG: dihydrodipicolinate synthase family protein [Chloroflexota bacterium]|nr:dihydrodipicolinate synthase family protein [Chloroflexota bacterium]